MTQFSRHTHRAREALFQVAHDYPGAWSAADQFRRARGEPGFDWPDWCFLPLAGAEAVVSDAGRSPVPLDRASDIARVGAMQAWRMTQGIFRFDPATYAAVRDTPITGDLPCDALMHMPQWCLYVETPDLAPGGATLHGFWAHLEYDFNTHRTELRFLLDFDRGLVPMPMHLGAWPLAEGIARMLDVAKVQAAVRGIKIDGAAAGATFRGWAEPLVSLLLYVCSVADFSQRGRDGTPANPAPKRTRRHGMRLFPADGPVEWDVGVRMGAALRAAYQAAEVAGDRSARDSTHARPRGHVRRAHWHGFWSGPMKAAEDAPAPRRYSVRWLPPIPVNLPDVAALPATIRTVRDQSQS